MYLLWKWMSAITGICDLRTISGSAAASTGSGTATRTIWQPVAVSAAICCSVALTSAVTVVVIDCTLMGAPPPTRTPPTSSCRVFLRSASRAGGSSGMPSETGTAVTESFLEPDRVDDVGAHDEQRQAHEQQDDGVGQRHQLVEVDPLEVAPV